VPESKCVTALCSVASHTQYLALAVCIASRDMCQPDSS